MDDAFWSYSSDNDPLLKLPNKALDYLTGRDSKVDAWATGVALAFYFMNAGLSESDFIRELESSVYAKDIASDDVRRDRRNRLASRLRKMWSWAEEQWNSPFAADVFQELLDLEKAIHALRWGGRSSSNDRAVMLALIEWAIEVGSNAVDANIRDLGVRAGVPFKTASRALARLARMGYLEKGAKPQLGSAQRWRIVVKAKYVSDTYKPIPPIYRSYVSLTEIAKHDVFVRGGLGATAGRLCEALKHGRSVTAKELAQHTGLTEQTARANLKRLAGQGLVTAQGVKPVKYTLATDITVEQLDAIASRLNVAGLRQVQKDLRNVDRDLFGQTREVWERRAQAVARRAEAKQQQPQSDLTALLSYTPRHTWKAVRLAQAKPNGVTHCGVRRRLEEEDA